jgi:Carboxypeptidase regulatory-like domain
MKSLAVLVIGIVMTLTALTYGQTFGLIAGITSVDGKPFPNITVRLRNVDNGQLISNTVANSAGGFSFNGLAVGNYVVEMVASNGTILGTSVGIVLTPLAIVSTNISVGASAAALAAAGGTGATGGAVVGSATAAGTGTGAVAGSVAAAGATTGAAGLSATVIAVSAVGVTLGTTAVVAVANDASPSR